MYCIWLMKYLSYLSDIHVDILLFYHFNSYFTGHSFTYMQSKLNTQMLFEVTPNTSRSLNVFSVYFQCFPCCLETHCGLTRWIRLMTIGEK